MITAVAALASYYAAFTLTNEPSKLFLASSVVTLITAGAIIYLRVRERDFYYIALDNRKHKDDWVGSGTFEFNRSNECFRITNSDAGFIFDKCLTWSDYTFTFEFKILTKSIGAIVRAGDLSNLIMLQLFPHGVKPHIRVNGGWSWQEPEEAALLFQIALSLDHWYRCSINCDKGDIRIRLFDGTSEIFDRNWRVPQGSVGFLFPKHDKDTQPLNIPFPIELAFGTVGFRNFGNEDALVRGMLVEKTKT